jgi:hypothetical protein
VLAVTPAERAVIDAAKKWAWFWMKAHDEDEPYPSELHQDARDELFAAVRALPRPLSEQLAELQPGAVVDGRLHGKVTVICNSPDTRELWVRLASTHTRLCGYDDITRIISNPEPSNG